MPPTPIQGRCVTRFQTTRWSLVLQARDGDEPARRALETLCRTYRTPVLAYIRSRGTGADEAEDLAQTFFTRFIERGLHVHADPARGRFRSFLLTALQRFLNDAHDHAHAMKRGGQVQMRSLDDSGPSSLEGIPSTNTPEREFDRAWAQAVMNAALRRLRREAREAGKITLFEGLSEFLVERPDEADYARVAESLKLRRNTLAVAVHRMRNRLRELVCEELAQTAMDDEHLDQELTDLRYCLGAVF